jgi:hypothetical protein
MTTYVGLTGPQQRDTDGVLLVKDPTPGQAGGVAPLDSNGKIPFSVRSEFPPNALEKGAIGDGNPANAAADTVAINQCLALGGVTLPPRHTFTLSDRITSDLDELVIVGGGASSKLQLAPGVNKNALRINTAGVATARLRRVMLKDFYLDHQAQAGGQALAGSGIEACLVVYAVDKVIIDNVHVANPLNVGMDVRACKYVRIRNPFVENLIHSGQAGNAINVGAHQAANGGGEDYVVEGPEVTGGGDVAVWLSGWGARRLECTHAKIRGDGQRVVTDAEVIAGSLNVVHSETAGFTTADIGKLVYLITAAGARSGPFRISGIVDSAHATFSSNATAMVGATAAIGIQNSGVISEGGNLADDAQVMLAYNEVESPWNVGLGFSDAGGGGTLKHQKSIAVHNEVTNAQANSIALALVGRMLKAESNIIDSYLGNGIVVGGGPDFDAYGIDVLANQIAAAAAATGAAIRVTQSGAYTNFLHDLLIGFNLLMGNGGATAGSGLELIGKIKDAELPSNRIRDFARSGLLVDASGGASPAYIAIRGGYSKNNNRAGNAAGINSVGYSFNAGDSITLEGVVATDDQALKTQTHGMRWLNATRGRIRRNDFRGNASGSKNVSFDALTIYQDNIEQDGAYEGTATLVGGVVTVSTAAASNSSIVQLQVITPGGTQGALYVDQVINGTSFRIRSTSASDTSTVKWRIT